MTDLLNFFITITGAVGAILLIKIWQLFRDVYPPSHRKNRWQEQQQYPMIGPVIRWRPWFAWRPVRTVSGQVIWWQSIYRTIGNDYVDHDDWTWHHYGNLFDVIKNGE